MRILKQCLRRSVKIYFSIVLLQNHARRAPPAVKVIFNTILRQSLFDKRNCQ